MPASAQSDALEAISLLPAGAAVDLGRLLVVGQTMRPDGNPGEGVVVIGDVAP